MAESSATTSTSRSIKKFDPNDGILPLLVRSPNGTTDRSHKWNAQKYFGLTQVCKQTRTEYRPLWLRASSFRLELGKVDQFISTYYPKIEEYLNAPKLLVISWDHGDTQYEDAGATVEDVLINITQLLRLRARSPTFECAFVSRRLWEGDLPNIGCEDCGHRLHCECDTDCYHEDAHDEAYEILYMEYAYLDYVNSFLAHRNEAWLKLLRRDDIMRVPKVEFSFELGALCPTFHIHFKKGRAPPFFSKQSLHKRALRFLSMMGMVDFEEAEEYGYVIDEVTGKYTCQDNCCSTSIPIYNQYYMSGLKKNKKPAPTIEAASA